MMSESDILSEVDFRFEVGRLTDVHWTVAQMHVEEAISELYRTGVVLALEATGPTLDTLVGQAATLVVRRDGRERFFHGVVQSVEELGTLATQRFVRIDVVPSLWLLSQRKDTRIFQKQNVIQIVQAVLRDAGIYQGAKGQYIDPSLFEAHPREYCVQHCETDLAFVRRLLEDEGIPFYFRHDGEGEESIVFAGEDHAFADTPFTAGGAARISDQGATTESRETVHWFDERHTLRTTSVQLRDYDFTRPRASVDMTAQYPAEAGRLPYYEFPARATITQYDEDAATYQAHNTRRLARVRLEEHRTRDHVGQGRSNLHALTPGFALRVVGHERSALDRKYLVTRVEHTGQAWATLPAEVRESPRARRLLRDLGIDDKDDRATTGDRYANRFYTHRIDDMETTVPFRPERVTPRPVVEGPQTARVVGPEGEDIHTDKHGRIKVQFHWDRQGKEDEHSSCWVRCTQNMGGAGWGYVFIPRIGMEVLVNFLEGDSDRPVVTSVVYNGENETPYDLPGEKTKTTIKTWSTPKTGGYNELRFEDKAGAEQLFMQAERNMDTLVKNDQTLKVNRHRTKHVEGHENNTVDQNRATTVGGNEGKEVFGNQENMVHGPQGQNVGIDANQIVRIGQSMMEAVGQNKEIGVGEKYELTVGKSKFTMLKDGTIMLQGVQILIAASGPVQVLGKVIDLN